MDLAGTRSVRIVGPIHYTAADGHDTLIPMGAAILEAVNPQLAELVWGEDGENAVTLPMTQLEQAVLEGALIAAD
jgi:hypothetical protein